MANRIATHILKNSNVPSRPLPSVLLAGEPIVNTADGIVYFSGNSASSNNWVPAGTGGDANFFEAGSNLYDLQLRNRITKYEGISGASLAGKFLSGTSTGFVLANIASIGGVDTYVTGFTYSNNVATVKQNQGQPDLTILIDTMTGLTVNGALSATTGNIGTINTTTLNATGGTITTLGSTTANLGTANVATLNATGGTITTLSSTTLSLGSIASYNGLTNVAGQFLSGTSTGFVLAPVSSIVGIDTFTTAFTYSNNVATIKRNQGQPDLTILINTMTGLTVNGTVDTTTLNATGGTITTLGSTTATLGTANITTENVNTLNATGATITTLGSTTLNLGKIASYNSLTNVTGQFLSGTTSGFELAPISAITGVDTYVTGFTYSPTTNTITLSQNQGQADKTIGINVVSGLTVSDLTANRLVYTTTSGKLITGTATFDGTDMALPVAGSLTVGTGGLTIGSGGSPSVAGTGDLVVNGSLTVFGASISAFTSQLYVEDNNITLNYNPTGNTTATSIGSGWLIQDGNGVNGGSVNLDIRAMNTFTGLTSTQVPSITEYAGSTGYANRAWVTQLNDVVIRSTSVSTPNGVRILAEFDVLDGGTY